MKRVNKINQNKGFAWHAILLAFLYVTLSLFAAESAANSNTSNFSKVSSQFSSQLVLKSQLEGVEFDCEGNELCERIIEICEEDASYCFELWQLCESSQEECEQALCEIDEDCEPFPECDENKEECEAQGNENNTAPIASGNWSDPAIWKDGNLPVNNADIVVPQGKILIVDKEFDEKFNTITIEGTLRFKHDVNTRINVGTITSKHESLLEIGTETQPIAGNVSAKIMFADFGPVTKATDPKQLERGAILMGKTVIFGAHKKPWLSLTVQPIAGDSLLTFFNVPDGWQVGDRLVVAGTDAKDPTSDEVVIIESIEDNTVYLSKPLTKDHVGPKDFLQVHVANLSRNVEFFSENPSLKHRGHVMFMHNLNVNVNYARFYQLGRTDKSIPLDDWSFPSLDDGPAVPLEGNNIRGRYSVHFHHGGTDINQTPAKVEGNVVEGSPGWAYVNHSSNVDFINNVSYNVVGGAFQTEAGDELGSFVNNIAIRTVNPSFPLLTRKQGAPDTREDRQDFAFQGDAFWIHGGGVKLEGNVVSGASGHAFIYWPEGLIEPEKGMMKFKTSNLPGKPLPESIKEIDIWYVPINSFKNNQAYSVTRGLTFFYLHASFFKKEEQVTEEYLKNLHSTFEDGLIWNVRLNAVDFNFTEKVTLKNFQLYGGGDSAVVGVDANHFHNMNDYRFENLTIEGFGVGMDVPTQGNIVIEGGNFSNLTDFRIANPQTRARTLDFNNINFQTSELFAESSHFEMKPDLTLYGEVQNGLEGNEEHLAAKYPLFFLMPDRITLNYGSYQNKGLYFAEQSSDFVPMSSNNASSPLGVTTPSQYVGKSNQTLYSEFGLRMGSSSIAKDATESPLVKNGFLGSASTEAVVMPPEIDY